MAAHIAMAVVIIEGATQTTLHSAGLALDHVHARAREGVLEAAIATIVTTATAATVVSVRVSTRLPSHSSRAAAAAAIADMATDLTLSSTLLKA